jgi:hypothetical protein
LPQAAEMVTGYAFFAFVAAGSVAGLSVSLACPVRSAWASGSFWPHSSHIRL